MGILIAVCVVIFFVASLILPWVQRGDILNLKKETKSLKDQLRSLLKFLEEKGYNIPQELNIKQTLYPWQLEQLENQRRSEQQKQQAEEKQVAKIVEEKADKKEIEIQVEQNPENRISFEQQFGKRLPVWIGGIALAFAGFFLVKYSIETGLLSPSVRVVLGIIFGVGLIYSANWVRNKPDFANGKKISQALTGAGIADLYVCIFAATSLYGLVPNYVGFAGMALVTAAAVVLSIRYGMPIALLGLIGGFLTPALLGSQNPQAPILFIYLYLVLAGLMTVIKKHNWWMLSIPTTLISMIWVLVWLFGSNNSPDDSLWLGLFLMAVSATVVFASKEHLGKEVRSSSNDLKPVSILNYLSLGGALAVMGIVVGSNGFSFADWGLFGLLSLGLIGLAFFDQKLYGIAPWLSMAVTAAMLVSWDFSDANSFALILVVFGLIYLVSGYLLQSRSEKPLLWSGLTAATAIGYFLIGYFALKDTEIVADITLFWGSLALTLCGLSISALKNLISEIPEGHEQKQNVLAIYAATATAFLSIGLSIELKREFLSVAFAAQMLAICWINTKFDIKALRHIAAILAGVFGFLLIPQLLLLVQLTAYSLVEAELQLQQGIPIVNWPTFQLGAPALFFITASYLLRQQKDDNLVRAFEVSAIALVGIMGYYITRNSFHPDDNVLFVKAGFFERGVITNVLFLYGLACLYLGRVFARPTVSLGGFTLSAIAVFRIIYFDLISYNPIWASQAVGELPIANTLILAYGLPIIWTFRVTQEATFINRSDWNKFGYVFMLLLSFTLISMNVRQFFHGTYLNGVAATNAEIYTYSVAWLVFGIVLLVLGTARQDKMIRIASLILMILTAGKVFLYDASELEGLYRVFSFFGLGLSLLGLSWFYTKFIFRDLKV